MGVWLWQWAAASASETVHAVTMAEGGVQQARSAWGPAQGSQGPTWPMPGDRQRSCRGRAALWSSGRGLVLPSLLPPCPAARVLSWGSVTRGGARRSHPTPGAGPAQQRGPGRGASPGACPGQKWSSAILKLCKVSAVVLAVKLGPHPPCGRLSGASDVRRGSKYVHGGASKGTRCVRGVWGPERAVDGGSRLSGAPRPRPPSLACFQDTAVPRLGSERKHGHGLGAHAGTPGAHRPLPPPCPCWSPAFTTHSLRF